MPVYALRSRAARIVVALIVGAVAALAVALGNLWIKCLQPAAEACIWSKAYLPVSLGFTAIFLGVPVFIVTLILLRRYARTLPR